MKLKTKFDETGKGVYNADNIFRGKMMMASYHLFHIIFKIETFLTIIIFLILPYVSFAQWKLTGAQGEYLFNITRIDSTLFVGAFDGVYISNKTGINDLKKVNSSITQVQRFYKYEDKVLAVANSGLYSTTIPFNYWQQLNNDILPGYCLLTLDDIWLAGITGDGVYRSTDKGRNWSRNAIYGDSLREVTSLLGREVAILVDEFKDAGSYEVEFDASHLSSGIYFYKLQTENYSSIKKMIYLK